MNTDGNSNFIVSNGCHASLLLIEAHEVAVVGGEGETVLAQEEPSGKRGSMAQGSCFSCFPLLIITQIDFIIVQKNYLTMSPCANGFLCTVPAISRVSVGQSDGWENLR